MADGIPKIDAETYNQMMMQIYLQGKEELGYLFPNIGIAEYMILHIIEHIDDTQDNKNGRVYLKELANKMEMSQIQVSKLAKNLSEKGLVEWTHNPKEPEKGTYLMISTTGRELLEEQQNSLKNNITYVIKEVGSEKLIDAFRTFYQVRNALKEQTAAQA